MHVHGPFNRRPFPTRHALPGRPASPAGSRSRRADGLVRSATTIALLALAALGVVRSASASGPSLVAASGGEVGDGVGGATVTGIEARLDPAGSPPITLAARRRGGLWSLRSRPRPLRPSSDWPRRSAAAPDLPDRNFPIVRRGMALGGGGGGCALAGLFDPIRWPIELGLAGGGAAVVVGIDVLALPVTLPGSYRRAWVEDVRPGDPLLEWAEPMTSSIVFLPVLTTFAVADEVILLPATLSGLLRDDGGRGGRDAG